MNVWIKELFGVEKPVIGMCHMHALPGDPLYDEARGMTWVYEQARGDLLALQEGGVDAALFSNEYSLPYLTSVETVTVACMAAVISELKRDIKIPFGVNVLWDPRASLDLAKATGARFVREIFTGVYASYFGLWNTNVGEVIRRNRYGCCSISFRSRLCTLAGAGWRRSRARRSSTTDRMPCVCRALRPDPRLPRVR